MKTELYARFVEYYGRMPKSRKEFARFVLFVRGALWLEPKLKGRNVSLK